MTSKDDPSSTIQLRKLLDYFHSKEILLFRSLMSLALSCFIFVATSLSCSALLELTFFHPITFLTNVFSTVFDPLKVFLVVILSTTCFPVAFARLKNFSCSPRKFQIKRDGSWILLFFLTNLAADSIFLLSVMANLNYRLSLDATYVFCYFAIACSVYLSGEFFYSGAFILNFPDYVKPKFNLFVENLERICNYLLQNGWKVFIAIFFSYMIFGHYVVDAFVKTLLPDTVGNLPVRPFSILNVIYITWLMLVCFALTVFRRKLTEYAFNIWLCQPYKFDIPSPDVHKITASDHESFVPNISDAMACDEIELIQYLAFWDFSRLTRIDKVRVHQIFLVSRPGGHPRPWNALRNECSRLIENFLATLSDLNSKLALRWEAAFSLKDLSESTKMDILHKIDSNKSSLRDLEKLLAETNVFNRVQLLKWLIEGLGNILCAAYTEDRLGVVQIDLPYVLGSFCDSYLQLEKFGRLSTTQYIDTSKRRLIDTSRVALKTELTKSLRCIKSTYGEHLWNIDLKDEHRTLMQSF